MVLRRTGGLSLFLVLALLVATTAAAALFDTFVVLASAVVKFAAAYLPKALV